MLYWPKSRSFKFFLDLAIKNFFEKKEQIQLNVKKNNLPEDCVLKFLTSNDSNNDKFPWEFWIFLNIECLIKSDQGPKSVKFWLIGLCWLWTHSLFEALKTMVEKPFLNWSSAESEPITISLTEIQILSNPQLNSRITN